MDITNKKVSFFTRSLIETSFDPLFVIDEEGLILQVNEATVKATGDKRVNLIDSHFVSCFSENTKAHATYKSLFAMGTIKDVPLVIKGETDTPVVCNGAVYTDERGIIFGVIIARDVTEQKLLSKYSLGLIEASIDPLVTINAHGKIKDLNEAAVRITGCSREELSGTDLFDYFSEPEKAYEIYRDIFSKGAVANAELKLRNKSGKLIDVLINGSVYKDDRGNVLGVMIVIRDVTEQKRYDRELNKAKETSELAREVAEEAKSKAESATQIAEDAVKAKQQFLSNMSHEIRTPMNSIIGFTKVVLKTELTIKQKEYLQAIKMSGDALIALINDILDLAKVDAGKMTFERTPFKLSQSISAMLHLFETKIQEKNLTLNIEYDETIPEVLLGDPVRLHQIILNLVSNAVKFTNQGNIMVKVCKQSEDDTKVKIEFAVSDSGIGIPPEKIKSIFENFQQASSDTSRLYGGTGLGLAIVKQLVEPQGGTINVESEVEVGSTFSFVLEFLKTDLNASNVSDDFSVDSAIKNISILVVEDIQLNQLLMKTLLDDFGFKSTMVSNGKLAIDKVKENSYDVILMDLQMPVMNGFEATQYIRDIMKSDVPIIALTADVTTVDLAKCTSVGMNDYIAKPVDERLLYNKILGQLKRKPVMKVVKEAGEVVKSSARCTNLKYLQSRTQNNISLMMEMIRLYLNQTPPLLVAMRKAMDEKNWSLLQASAHKMIPSFSIMGMSVDYENMARQIQQYDGLQGQSTTIDALLRRIDEVCTNAFKELEEEYIKLENKNK
jgi:PAS domain S-box-containing protein